MQEFENEYKQILEQNLPQLHILWMDNYVSLSDTKGNDDSQSKKIMPIQKKKDVFSLGHLLIIELNFSETRQN